MAPTVADYLLERLRAWDVQHVFAYAGDGINGILAAWGRAENKPQFIQARHEEMAAFEAVGYAKFTGRVGVCMATSGPGAIHLLNGLYDAKLDHVPGGGDRGPDQPQRHGRLLPAGSRPAVPVQGRGQRVRADGDGARAAAQRAGPGHPHRPGRAGAHRDHHPGRRAGAGVLGAHATRSRWCPRRSGSTGRPPCRTTRRSSPGRRGPQRREQGRHPGRAGRPRGPPRARGGRRAARRRGGQAAAGQGRALRRAALRDRGPSACSAPGRATS